MIDLSSIATEQRNKNTTDIDSMSTFDMLKTINNEDKKVALAVEKALPQIAAAVDHIANSLKNGGRLFYIGAGTSGRLGILDAVECPPTFGTNEELVQGIIAGGHNAIFRAVEGAEDSETLARDNLLQAGFSTKDVLVGIAASGRTPYTVAALEYANSIGAYSIALVCSPDSPMEKTAKLAIIVQPGPEVVTGSTRLKAGTCQKLVLNMLSTGAMIRLGKVYGNLMVDVKSSNKKLTERSIHIVMEASGCSRQEAQETLKMTGGKAKLAIFMLLSGLELKPAQKALDQAEGYIGKALKEIRK